MAIHHLGPQIDIHGGGADLNFPHHTCEIAQSEHYTGKVPFSRIWAHTGMVYQNGEKMSKSLGNLTLIGDLLKDYSPDAIRVTLLNHHYRHPWECFPADLKSASAHVEHFQHLRMLFGRNADGEDLMLRNRFMAAMDDDLNTPEALWLLREASEQALEQHDLNIGTEVLHLLRALGLCV